MSLQPPALEHVDGDRTFGAVRGQVAAGADRHQREAKRSLLHQRARAAAMLGKQRLIDHPLVLLQVLDEHVAFDGPLQ